MENNQYKSGQTWKWIKHPNQHLSKFGRIVYKVKVFLKTLIILEAKIFAVALMVVLYAHYAAPEHITATTITTPQTFPKILQEICNAEVTGNKHTPSHQFNKDGSVVRGHTTPSDIGYCQINEPIWNDKARKMNMDIYTEQGNKDFALYLFNNYGTEPWNSSKDKWNK